MGQGIGASGSEEQRKIWDEGVIKWENAYDDAYLRGWLPHLGYSDIPEVSVDLPSAEDYEKARKKWVPRRMYSTKFVFSCLKKDSYGGRPDFVLHVTVLEIPVETVLPMDECCRGWKMLKEGCE